MASEQRFQPEDPLADLVAASLEGSQAAWQALVTRLQRVVWKSVNMMSSDREVREDAFAATWLRLAERLHTIREPEKLPGWLTTTACNEVRQIVRHRGRDHISLSAAKLGDFGASPRSLIETMVGDAGEHGAALEADERQSAIRDAFRRLDENCREVVTLLVLADPPVPYDEASERLGRPIGSLGPTRRRCLDKLKDLLNNEPEHGDAP